jgi:hypothetical protein
VPHTARVYNYWLGGKDNFEADRAAAERVIATYPEVLIAVRAQRLFLSHVVHFLADEIGIRQFLDIGTGLPSADSTHEVAQRVAPESRIAYVDNDPIVLSHARALLESTPEGATTFLQADLRDTGGILADAATFLDFRKPVAVTLLGILQSIADEDDPYRIVMELMDAVPSGSYLAISHIADDVDAGATRAMRNYNDHGGEPITPRSKGQVCRFFDGLDVLEPGVVQLHRWRPRAGGVGAEREVPIYGAVGRKP